MFSLAHACDTSCDDHQGAKGEAAIKQAPSPHPSQTVLILFSLAHACDTSCDDQQGAKGEAAIKQAPSPHPSQTSRFPWRGG
eukprot:1159074-Pelagomonas_calceolata.AAC.11